MKLFVHASICAAMLLGSAIGAQAQKPKPSSKNAATVTLTNGRSAPLQQLEVSTTGDKPTVVAKLSKPLAPGKSATLPIKGKRGCTFDVRGAYSDDATVENDGVDLCKDSKLRLGD